jgi:hypothetical protein
MPTVAFPQDHVPRLARQLNSQNVPYSDQKAWVGVATLSGLPATIAPIGHSESGRSARKSSAATPMRPRLSARPSGAHPPY